MPFPSCFGHALVWVGKDSGDNGSQFCHSAGTYCDRAGFFYVVDGDGHILCAINHGVWVAGTVFVVFNFHRYCVGIVCLIIQLGSGCNRNLSIHVDRKGPRVGTGQRVNEQVVVSIGCRECCSDVRPRRGVFVDRTHPGLRHRKHWLVVRIVVSNSQPQLRGGYFVVVGRSAELRISAVTYEVYRFVIVVDGIVDDRQFYVRGPIAVYTQPFIVVWQSIVVAGGSPWIPIERSNTALNVPTLRRRIL